MAIFQAPSGYPIANVHMRLAIKYIKSIFMAYCRINHWLNNAYCHLWCSLINENLITEMWTKFCESNK
ncbi:unnamed protein product, partial [Musa acuminata var. zebrina]